MPDLYEMHASGLTAPAQGAADITPSDTGSLTTYTRAIYVGGDGNMRVELVSGNIVTLTGVIAGNIYPIRARQVLATGTTATALVGFW